MPAGAKAKYFPNQPIGDTPLEEQVVHIYEDQPETGLVTIAYEPTLDEWNLDVTGGEKTIVVPEVAFRKAARLFVGLTG